MPRPADSKQRSDTDASSSPDAATSESEDSYGRPRGNSLFGRQSNRLRWDPASSRLSLDIRQSLQTRRSIEGGAKALLDTQSGQLVWELTLSKRLRQGKYSSMARLLAADQGMETLEMDGQPSLDPDKFLPAGLSTLLLREWSLSPGVRLRGSRAGSGSGAAPAVADLAAAASGSSGGGDGSSLGSGRLNNLKYCLTLRKEPQVLRRTGRFDGWLTAKLDAELDPASSIALRGSLRLKAVRYALTDKQDVQLSAGCDWSHSGGAGGKGSLVPYLKVGDNSWTARWKNRALLFALDLS